MYVVEKTPLPLLAAGRTANPVTGQMRKLEVGESFVVAYDDPALTGSQVRNENQTSGKKFVTVKESSGLRIGRVK